MLEADQCTIIYISKGMIAKFELGSLSLSSLRALNLPHNQILLGVHIL